ncbi:MAG: hypothetical protein J5J00_00245 [Deltaproteobacteria bacterium]|nr:hypothetical protein [Deltaproteobacteria bacterium]
MKSSNGAIVPRTPSGGGHTGSAKPPAQAAGAEEQSKNPLMAKIQSTISQSDPEKWERYGDDLNTEGKYQKPRDAWEIVYCINIPNGILAFRSSQPLTSQYFGGGYTLTPLSSERYTVELRPRAWDPRTLIDPYFRAALEKDRQFQLLADGDVARQVFMQIKATIESFSGERREEIKHQIEQLAANITDRTAASSAEEWRKDSPNFDTTEYHSSFDGVDVTVSFTKKNGIDNYRLTFCKDKVAVKTVDAAVAKSIFEAVEEKQAQAALEALSKVLDGAGF